MIELTKHIEILLLENDCVIVPELGGFIAHYQPAHYEEDEGVFLPPSRTVGFNPQLTMNDGLLAQAYMQTHHTDFSDASRQLAVKVNELKETLYNEGMVEMPGIGTLHYTMYNNYEFHPSENGILAPALYALDAFSIAPLSAEVAEEKGIPAEPAYSIVPEKKKVFTLDSRWWGNAVAVVIAAVLFFALSVPVENTYIDKGNYASLGTDCLFDAIRSQSMATALSVQAQEVPQKQNVKPVTVKVEKVAKPQEAETPKSVETPKTVEAPKVKEAPKAKKTAETKEAPKPKKEVKAEVKKSAAKPATSSTRKTYHLIVASLTTSADAERMLKEYKKQGYTNASVVQGGGGRFRISLCSFGNKAQAQNKLNELKKADAFKAAWMLTSK